MRKRWLIGTVALVVAAGCGKSEQEKQAEKIKEAAAQVAAGAQQAAAGAQQATGGAQQGAQQLAKGLEQFAKGLAQMGQGSANTTVIDFEVLKSLMPEIPGWTRGDVKGEQVSMGMKMSKARANYQKGDSTVRLEIVDTSFNQLFLAPLTMFMAAGLIYTALGHDRIAGLAGIARALPASLLAFVLGGLALTGVVPSGAYLAKKLLLDAAADTGQWWWGLVLEAGGFFTTGYVVLVLAHALKSPEDPLTLRARVPRIREAAALGLALCSLLLALAAFGPVPRTALSNPLAPTELWSALVLVVGGGVVAIALGRRLPPVRVGSTIRAIVTPVRRVAVVLGGLVEHADGVLRLWSVAGLSLLLLAIAFGVAMALGHGASGGG
jgi:hypothetical protein